MYWKKFSFGKPHNPFINAGAIVIASLVKSDMKLADRFDFLKKKYKDMAGGEFVGFSNAMFQSERDSADRNCALAYYMREHKCFPKDVNLQQTLDLYFQLCSVEVTCESAAVMAATLANGGVCPLTGTKVLSNRSVRDVLSLMYSCGMYDYSGQFAFHIGVPAKSGVSGGMILVVPNVVGFALWSPPLDSMSNSVRGVQFSKLLVNTFNFHNYDNLVHGDIHKIDPRKRGIEPQAVNEQQLISAFYACALGDLNVLKRYASIGMDLNGTNYDGRTALHVAASEGHYRIVIFLLGKNVRIDMKDRWNNTALDNAKQFGHADIVTAIEDYRMTEASAASSEKPADRASAGNVEKPADQATTPIDDKRKLTVSMASET